MKCCAFLFFAVLVSCDRTASVESKPTPIPEAELSKIMKYATERHSALLAAKYHLSPDTAQAITADFRLHQLLVVQALTSPAPKVENMQQTIERLSASYKVPPDVIASLVFDDLLLDQTLDEH